MTLAAAIIAAHVIGYAVSSAIGYCLGVRRERSRQEEDRR